jgi:hypothetical protein
MGDGLTVAVTLADCASPHAGIEMNPRFPLVRFYRAPKQAH